MNKICVYTCITGNYDNLLEIKTKEKNLDYYCFTNNKKIKSNTWNVIYIKDDNLSNVLLARKTKILGNDIVNSYDIALWMDASIEFDKPITDFIKEFLNEKDVFACFKHGIRKNILEEMDACLRFRKENIININKLKEFYKLENYSYNNGLIESTVYIKRPKNKKVIETMNLWFEMVKNYSKRDQLSFNYCINKTNLKVKWIDEKVFDNNWFSWNEHLKEDLPKNYLIYYGDINDYDYSKQIENNYIIKDNVFTINEKILNNTNQIYIELSDISMIKYNIINNIKKIDYQNTIDYKNYKVFFKTPGFIILTGNFKKNDKLLLNIIFEKVSELEKNKIIEILINKNVRKDYINYKNNKELEKLRFELSDITGRFNELYDSYNQIINSKSWNILQKIRGIFKK